MLQPNFRAIYIVTRILPGQCPGLPGSGTAYAEKATKGKWLIILSPCIFSLQFTASML